MEFFCSFSDEIHLTKEPMVLSKCGHYICLECYLKVSIANLECKTCGELNNETINTSILSIGDSFSTFEKQLKKHISKLKSKKYQKKINNSRSNN